MAAHHWPENRSATAHLRRTQRTLTGIAGAEIADGQKVHAHLVTPQIEFMIEQLERFFKSVRIVRYPHKADGVTGRAALIATDKR